MRKRRPARVSDLVCARRPTPPAGGEATLRALGKQAVLHQGVEVAADRSRRQTQLRREPRGILRPAFEHEPHHGVTRGAVLAPGPQFHNTSMTYLPGQREADPPAAAPG